ncbi:juxtaposed with another zinc finger protein 1 isoform X4 [Neofelis nebulosa]|uniref:juxtaposed with another zinc finger protein 1 isoform X4 n=1 Tax=Neofelis nebulosa TaxID=61452 RepID=UPI00272A24F3|nr:juxtaposed with another zinc finger protein 1 isoform X4 [Neofelis nebulosa]
MTGIAAASFFSNTCRFGGCGLHFPTLADLIEHIEDNHIDTDPRVLEKQELQQPTYVALSYINRFMTDAARREQESLKKKIQPKLSLTLSSSVSRGNVSTPPRHSSGSLTPPVTPPITPSSSFRSSTPTGRKDGREQTKGGGRLQMFSAGHPRPCRHVFQMSAPGGCWHARACGLGAERACPHLPQVPWLQNERRPAAEDQALPSSCSQLCWTTGWHLGYS